MQEETHVDWETDFETAQVPIWYHSFSIKIKTSVSYFAEYIHIFQKTSHLFKSVESDVYLIKKQLLNI